MEGQGPLGGLGARGEERGADRYREMGGWRLGAGTAEDNSPSQQMRQVQLQGSGSGGVQGLEARAGGSARRRKKHQENVGLR